jgi:hypothetical protein
MLHLLGCLVFQIKRQVNDAHILLHVVCCDLADPTWDGCRKQANLKVSFALLLDKSQNVLNVLFKAKFKHLVGLV